MVSLGWKSVQSGTLYVALIPSARVFNSEQAELGIGPGQSGRIDGCEGGRRFPRLYKGAGDDRQPFVVLSAKISVAISPTGLSVPGRAIRFFRSFCRLASVEMSSGTSQFGSLLHFCGLFSVLSRFANRKPASIARFSRWL